MRRGIAGLAMAVALIAGCGDPAPSEGVEPSQDGSLSGQFQCLGVAPSKCQEYLRSAQVRGVVSAIRIVCTKPPCNEQRGEVTIDVLYADGQRSSSGEGWATLGGVGAPAPLPVPAATPIAAEPSG